jgi:two-component system OmpR family response regulator
MKHVLLVEDDPDVRALLSEILHDAGYGVSEVPTVADARNLIDGTGLDLIVTDVVLPDGRGTELADYAQRRGLRSLILTGNVDRMQELQLKERHYLAKPFRPKEFLASVEASFN